MCRDSRGGITLLGSVSQYNFVTSWPRYMFQLYRAIIWPVWPQSVGTRWTSMTYNVATDVRTAAWLYSKYRDCKGVRCNQFWSKYITTEEHRMSYSVLLRIIKKSRDQKAEGTRGDHQRDFWIVTFPIPCIIIQLLVCKPADARSL